jgi:hypothetical protein
VVRLHPFVILFGLNGFLRQYVVHLDYSTTLFSLALRQLVSNDFLRQYDVALTLALHRLVPDRTLARPPSARFDLSTMHPFVRTLRFLVCANLLLGGNAYFLMGGVGTLKMDRVDPIVSNGTLGAHAHHIMGSSAFSLIRPTSEELRAATCTSMPIVEDFSSYWHPTASHDTYSIEADLFGWQKGSLEKIIAECQVGKFPLSQLIIHALGQCMTADSGSSKCCEAKGLITVDGEPAF